MALRLPLPSPFSTEAASTYSVLPPSAVQASPMTTPVQQGRVARRVKGEAMGREGAAGQRGMGGTCNRLAEQRVHTLRMHALQWALRLCTAGLQQKTSKRQAASVHLQACPPRRFCRWGRAAGPHIPSGRRRPPQSAAPPVCKVEVLGWEMDCTGITSRRCPLQSAAPPAVQENLTRS